MEEKTIKKTTYQKLKESNSEMINNIRILIKEPDSAKAMSLRLQYNFIFDAEDSMFSGDSSVGLEELIELTENKK